MQSEKYKQITQQRDEIEEELYQLDKDISNYQNLTSDNIKKTNAVLKERINAFREANKNRTSSSPKYFKEVIKIMFKSLTIKTLLLTLIGNILLATGLLFN